MINANASPMQKEEWDREFFERFGADKIWVVPSRDNVETILGIYSFISHQISLVKSQERQRIVEMLLNIVEQTNWIEEPKSAFGKINKIITALTEQR